MSSLLSGILNHPSTLPVLTSLIGTGGLTVGIYSFINPLAAARIYGVPIRAPDGALINVLIPSAKSDATSSKNGLAKSKDHDLSYIHALGIRNLTAGLTILSLTYYWHLVLPTTPLGIPLPKESIAVQRALGIVILVGSLVPMVDAWVCWSASRAAVEASSKDRKDAVKEDEKTPNTTIEAHEVGRKAGNLHAMRSLIWVAGALWCLLG